MMSAQELLEANGIRLKDYKPGEHSTTCPDCSDKRKRENQKKECLSVKIDGQGATWMCHHCGWSGPEKGNGRSNGQDGEFVATYDYAGFQKVRYPKGHEPRFRIRHRVGSGWKWGAGNADTSVLYRKDEIEEAIAFDRTILLVEGEKDADRLWSIGIPTTCNAHGAADPTKNQKPKWKVVHSLQLAGADIVVIPDHDGAGYAHAEATCQCSLGAAKRVRRLVLHEHWPDCPKGGDVSDYLDAGHTREELDALIESASDYVPGPTTEQPIGETFGAQELEAMTFNPIKYVVPGIFIEGLTLFAGKPKTGKSWLLLHAAIAVARGGYTLGDIHCIEGDVLYCALEDSKRRLQSRMTKLVGSQGYPKGLSFRCEMPRLSGGGLDVIRDWIASQQKPRLVIIDTLAMVRSPKKQDESTYDSDYAAVLELRKLANETGVAIIVVHHLRKADSDDAFDTISGTLGLTGAPDTIMVLKRDAPGTYPARQGARPGRDREGDGVQPQHLHVEHRWRGHSSPTFERAASRTRCHRRGGRAGRPQRHRGRDRGALGERPQAARQAGQGRCDREDEVRQIPNARRRRAAPSRSFRRARHCHSNSLRLPRHDRLRAMRRARRREAH
jgi:hypothetical protein